MIVDLTGQRFNHLTVIKIAGRDRRGRATWLCHCDCGSEKVIGSYDLRSGNTSSCGCRKKSHAKTHGQAGRKNETAEHRAWTNMLSRCRNPNATGYEDYGGRGITVCEYWYSFENFYTDMGDKPTPEHTLERIDNNKGYYKENCCWDTRKKQAQNQRPRKAKDLILNEDPTIIE